MDGAMNNLTRMDLASTALHPTLHTPPTLLIRLILPSSNPSQNATSKFHCALTSTSPVVRLNPLTSTASTSPPPLPTKCCATRKRIEDLRIADMMLTTPSWRPC